jgi:hypothetical protein
MTGTNNLYKLVLLLGPVEALCNAGRDGEGL